MGTKRTELQFCHSYDNFGPDKLKELHVEKIHIEMRDGTQIPLVLKYDRRFYNEESPWVFMTNGIQSNKGDDEAPAPASW